MDGGGVKLFHDTNFYPYRGERVQNDRARYYTFIPCPSIVAVTTCSMDVHNPSKDGGEGERTCVGRMRRGDIRPEAGGGGVQRRPVRTE